MRRTGVASGSAQILTRYFDHCRWFQLPRTNPANDRSSRAAYRADHENGDRTGCAQIMNASIKMILLTAAFLSPWSALAVEITEFEGGAHGFPALLDSNGKKLADGDFSQWIEHERLHITIIYNFNAGQRIEERAAFQQKPELIQEQWSWREIKEGQ